MPESRVLKYNEANVQKQKHVQRAYASQQTSQKGKKVTVASKTQSRSRENVKEKDAESNSSTPSLPNEKINSRSAKNSGSITPTSNDSSSDVPRKKKRYLFQNIW